ncbi:ATP-binding protein [Luteolibacter sp. LG18]|uniref:ATP-binding protein n=1 Tax=Luteolibacter sp. LG18 TaxID=2819286 RepID=UPI002B30A5F1|nr:hypothetical protein llg_18550 [Luteolibacter sp. LG18]
MKASWRHSLLAKMLGWLALHLLVLAVAFGGFIAVQLRVGLDSLLSGRTGDRLRDLGELVGGQLRSSPRSDWPAILSRSSANRKLQIDLWRPPDQWEAGGIRGIPRNVMERMRGTRLPQGGRQQSPPPLQRRAEDRPFPPPRALDGDPLEDGPPPLADHPPGAPPRDQSDGLPPPGARPLPVAAPVFLMRGDEGNGYWAGVEIALRPNRETGNPQHALLVIRADDLSADGLFFEVRPWIFGGFAVLAVSVAFWIPFALGITRYVGRLTRATERIAEGDFQVAVDVSRHDELGRLGAAVTEMAGRLDRFVSGQRRFLADVAHELCAPLARLRTGIAIMEQMVPEEHQPRLQSVDDDAGELARLIDEILAFSRAGAGRPQLRACDLEPLIESVVAREGADLKVSLKLEPELSAFVDPRLLSRAFGNLVRNVRVHVGEGADLSISAHRREGQVAVVFRDQGPGVPAADLPRLFEPFYRPDRSRNRDTGGSGLGLAIVSTCVEACGGRVSADVPADGGFEVTVILPMEASALPKVD